MKNHTRLLIGSMLLILVIYHVVATQKIDPRMNDETIRFVQKYIAGIETLNSSFTFTVFLENYLAHKQRHPKYYEDVTQVNLTAPGTSENGNYNVPLTAFVPKGYQSSKKIFVFIHGVIANGELLESTPILTHLAGALRTIFIYVGNRLAPFDGFPKGSNDCLVATKYIVENKNKLFRGLECHKIGLISSTVGSHHALYVANKLTKRNIAYHIALYPFYSFRPEDQVGGTMVEFNSSIYYAPIYIPLGYQYYVAPAVITYGTGLYSSTQFTPQLGITKDTPVTKIISPALDPTLDEGRRLKETLIKKGVYVEQNILRGTIHGCVDLLGFFPKTFNQAFDLIKTFISNN